MKTRIVPILITLLCVAMVSSFGITSAIGQIWTPTGDMNEHRYSVTATLLLSGKVLVAGGRGTGIQSAELYDPATGLWTATGSMNFGRYVHTATLLTSGKVLVAAGNGFGSGFEGTAELYDPATETWTLTGDPPERKQHDATLLASGKVLMTGGLWSYGVTNETDLYDPATGLWTPTGSMTMPRIFHTETLLPSGKVLVAGGDGENGFITAELYDPATETWTLTGSMNTGRYNHTATLLPSGKVLVAGGDNDIDGVVSSAELYDPATGLWTATGNLLTTRDGHTATLLPSGQVLVAGGQGDNNNNNYLSSSELYDPATGLWTATGSLLTARDQHITTLLSSGKVLVAGGFNFTDRALSSAELYGPASPTPTPTATSTPTPTPTPTATATFTPTPTATFTPTPTPTPACAAQVQPPINADGSSVWTVQRGVVPVKFTLSCNGNPTCDLPPATIAVTRTAGGVIGEVNESVYTGPSDSGSNFRIDGCQYHYNLTSNALGVGTYRVDILINSQVVGSATFRLK